MQKLTRHTVRYWMFRFRTEETGGASAEGAPPGLRKTFEDHPHFGGWSSFGVTWDVDSNDPYRIIPLRHSLEQQWNTEAMASAREIPVKADPVPPTSIKKPRPKKTTRSKT